MKPILDVRPGCLCIFRCIAGGLDGIDLVEADECR